MYRVKIENLIFEWDEEKANANITKHGISFDEAITVFADECGVLFDDPKHSEFEERLILIGISEKLNLLTVCHCTRNNEQNIRIISARKATANETKTYLEFNGEIINERKV